YEKIEQTEGGCYLVLEYIPGQTLAERIAEGKLSLEEALKIGLQVVDALAVAHGSGLIHRDLKPSNIKITPEGNVKVLDFGLARIVGSQTSQKDSSGGRVGRIAGTPHYMSPEQALYKATDHRTDIWSFGCVLYEMLSGMRAFPGDSTSDALASVLAAEPDLEMLPAEVSPAMRKVIGKCLTTDGERRYESAAELRQDLRDCLSALTALPVDVNALWRFLQRPRVAVSVAFVFLALCSTALWLFNRNAKVKWARAEALPEIDHLIEQDKYFAAFVLAQQAEKYISKDPVLVRLWPRMSRNCSITTTPAGADIFFSEYLAGDTGWKHCGRSPLQDNRVPFGVYRWKVLKNRFETLEVVRFNSPSIHWGWRPATPLDKIHFALHEEGSLPPGTVWIPPSRLEPALAVLQASIPSAPAYVVDKYEVTNEQFKEFVDEGGYRKPDFWKDLRFVKDGHQLSWKEAVAQFCDSSGQPGPSTWDEGNYPKGQGDYPVSGVSWFEAAAYARFRGKSLPTLYHWVKAAMADDDPSRITRLSNFGDGLAPVGSHKGMGQFGVYDAAGNVREWCHNATDDSEELRYILGGAWNESTYMFTAGETRSPWDRDPANGFRCVRYLGGEETVPRNAFLPIEPRVGDFDGFALVSDEELRSYIDTLYDYDRTELHAVVERTDESPEGWRREKITFDAAYGNERVIAYLLLPKSVVPPYQTIVFFPGGGVSREQSSDSLRDEPEIGLLVGSGRALLYPIYKGTYERRPAGGAKPRSGTIAHRDWYIQMSKDLRRSIDYLETRDDIDTGKLAYVGLSWGGILGPIMMATEDRFEVGVILKAGIWGRDYLPAEDPVNFAPHVKIPVLMLSGRHDTLLPFERSQKPLFDLLGTPGEHKRHITYPGGHSITWEHRKKYAKDMLDWLDRYLGPVNYQP
ncbi:MAG: bifunctional serine/threonine-protein kinase/formylglycine-generating enzyme family protein, partial [Planctomycetota bacterium]